MIWDTPLFRLELLSFNMRRLAILLSFLFSLSQLPAQEIADYLKTPKGITDKMLELISGDIDEARDWEAYRNLFLPTAQKIIRNPNAQQISRQVRAMNLEEFVRYVGPQYKKYGFEEVSIGTTVNEFNGIAQVFQSFHAKNLTGTYEKRGINSYQLVFASGRWWIASTCWADETEEQKIPAKYLDDSVKNE